MRHRRTDTKRASERAPQTWNRIMTEISPSQRRASIRTALGLLSIVLTFFFGIILAQTLGSPRVSIGVVGTAVLLFLVFAIGRLLRRK